MRDKYISKERQSRTYQLDQPFISTAQAPLIQGDGGFFILGERYPSVLYLGH